jgi:hypothetical protein
MPAACVSRAPANRMLSSRSRGTPSRRELDISNCAIVASGFAYEERSMIPGRTECMQRASKCLLLWELERLQDDEDKGAWASMLTGSEELKRASLFGQLPGLQHCYVGRLYHL